MDNKNEGRCVRARNILPVQAPGNAPGLPAPATCSPLFVTWKKKSGSGDPRLRGCIGILEPRPLCTSLAEFAVTRCGARGGWAALSRRCPWILVVSSVGSCGPSVLLFGAWSPTQQRCSHQPSPDPGSALALPSLLPSLLPLHFPPTHKTHDSIRSAVRDRRFAPIQARELPVLECTVSLLHSFESDRGWDGWQPGTHGIIISFRCPHTGRACSATFLPEVAEHEGWSREETLAHLVQKAGAYLTPAELTALLPHIKLTRYQSTTATLTYQQCVGGSEGWRGSCCRRSRGSLARWRRW